MRSLQAFSALCALVLGFAAAARAEERAVRLVYERQGAAEERCPDQASLRQAVAVRLGYDPFVDSAAESVVVTVRAASRGFAGSIEIRDAGEHVVGARTLSSRGACADLFDTLALAVSIGVDPVRAAGRRPPELQPSDPRAVAPLAPPEPPQAQPAPPLPLTSPAPAVSPRAPTPRATSIVFRVSAGAELSFAALPSTSGGAWLGFGARVGMFGFELEGHAAWMFAQRDAAGGGAVDGRLFSVVVAPCVSRGFLTACALASLGTLEATGKNLDETRALSALRVQVGARVGVEVALTSAVSFLVRADVLVATRGVTLLTNDTVAWAAPLVSPRFGAGFAAQF